MGEGAVSFLPFLLLHKDITKKTQQQIKTETRFGKYLGLLRILSERADGAL